MSADFNAYHKLFHDMPDEIEHNIFAGEIWEDTEYTQIHQPGAASIDNEKQNVNDTVESSEQQELKIQKNDKDKIIEVDELPEYDGVSDARELKLIYRKVLCWTFIVLTFCIIALLAAIISSFYTWRGMTFNCIVILACLLGVYCGYNNDNKSKKHAVNKFKVLLIYWIILCFLISIIFVILIIYAFVMPVRFWSRPNYSKYTVLTSTVFYVFGIIFWLVFVSFYVDLIARACLKRGRIDYIILGLSKNQAKDLGNQSSINQNNAWFKIYSFIIWFRVHWREIRQYFTTFTGLRCVYDKNKLIKNKEHEEQRVIDMLEEGRHNIRRANFTDLLYCLVCPFVVCYRGMIQMGIECMKCCGGCIVIVCDCTRFSVGQLSICCYVCCGGIFTLVLLWIFFPIVLWIVIATILILFFVASGEATESILKLASNELFQCCAAICACGLALPIWYVIWFYSICVKPYDLSSDYWTWDEQCNMWYWVNIIVNSILEAF